MHTRFLSLPLALLALSAGAISAEPRQGALGADGTLYRVHAGRLRDLQPSSATPDNPILILTVTRPDGQLQRSIVPGTEGDEAESAAAVVYEETSNSAYLIWESRTNFIHSQIRLASFAASGWSLPMDLPGEFFSLKTSPSLAVTRDTYVTLGADGNPELHPRTLYHAVWWEEAAAGERVVYAPVLLLDGAHRGWSPSFVLADIAQVAPAEPLVLPTPELSRQPILQAGAKNGTVNIAFVSPAAGRFLQFEAQAVSGELAALAKVAADEISASSGPSATASALGQRVRAQLVEFGHRLHLHPGLVNYLVGTADAELASAPLAPASGFASLGERVRAQLVEFGVRMAAQGLGAEASEAPSWLLEFPSADPALEVSDNQPRHSVRLSLIGARPIPALPSASTSVYLSASGRHAIIAWEVGNRLMFRESTADGWSEERFLPLGPDLSLAEAHAFLERRGRHR